MEKEILPLTVVCPGTGPEGRAAGTLLAALAGHPYQLVRRLDAPPETRHVLFAVSLGTGGVNEGLPSLLGWLRSHPKGLDGCVGGVLVDGEEELWTRAVGRDVVLAASLAGCAFPGRPLVEGTGSLKNMTVQARNLGASLETAYRLAAADLTARMFAFSPVRHIRPKVLSLHASSYRTSNTLALWGGVKERVGELCEIREIGLRDGAVEDCAGCPYTTCLHYGEQGSCFYGGTMVREVYPALRAADAVVLLCPNYNDALPADLSAAINRMTALYRTASFADKAVYAIVVSGYSGGDLVAGQVVSAMAVNKGFWLPPGAFLMETANDAGTALSLPGIARRLDRYADGMLYWLRG